MTRIALALLLTAVAMTSVAHAAPTTYAQELVDQAAKRHPALTALALHVTPPKTSTNVVIASTDGRTGQATDGAGLKVIASGETLATPVHGGDRCKVELVLQDASRRAVGALETEFARKPGSDCAAMRPQAEAVRDELRRRISHVANLLEKYPFDPTIPTRTFAQHLVDEALDQHPDIIILAIHVPTPTNRDYPIIASNIGRIGKKADADDMEVIRSGKPRLEINESGDRFESEGALHDGSGRVIGAAGVVFPYKPGDDKQALHRRAEALRANWAKRIPDANALLAPYPPAS